MTTEFHSALLARLAPVLERARAASYGSAAQKLARAKYRAKRKNARAAPPQNNCPAAKKTLDGREKG